MQLFKKKRKTELVIPDQPFLKAFYGRFRGVMQWTDLDLLWNTLCVSPAAWYLYEVESATLPTTPMSSEDLVAFITKIDRHLRENHEFDYCGIVYTDNLESPHFVKIFEPSNLGVSCGFSEKPPLPGWILSQIPPVSLDLLDS